MRLILGLGALFLVIFAILVYAVVTMMKYIFPDEGDGDKYLENNTKDNCPREEVFPIYPPDDGMML